MEFERTSVDLTSESWSRLCEVCQTIDFDAFLPQNTQKLGTPNNTNIVRYPDGQWREREVREIKNYHWEESATSLGPMKAVAERSSSCAFCSLVYRHLRDVCSNALSKDWVTSTSCLIFSTPVGGIAQRDHPLNRNDLHFGLSTFRIGVALISADHTLAPVTEDHFVFSDVNAFILGLTRSGDDQALGSGVASCIGRYRPLRCDASRIIAWIRNCNVRHPKCISDAFTAENISNAKSAMSSHAFRVVDVTNRCLRTFSWAEFIDDPNCPQYLTLSYVWGVQTQKMSLTRANCETMHLPGSMPACSQTVEDAITIVASLGQKYLWVDVLCIVQDDPEDMALNISNMYRIYANSFLTLIVAGNGDADRGIPGISSDRPPQLEAHVGNNVSVYTAAKALRVTETGFSVESRWPTRAWMLQEQVLSRRCLAFTEDVMYWFCRCELWLEDLETEQEKLEIWHSTTYNAPEVEAHRAGFHAAPSTSQMDISDLDKSYSDLIRKYSLRELTREDDVENAFAGIMAILPGDFWFGIPVSRFEEFLCWVDDQAYVDQSYDFSHSSPQVMPRKRKFDNLEVPSWSWMAWRGRLTNASHSAYDFATNVACFRLWQDPDDVECRGLAPISDIGRHTDVRGGALVKLEDIPPGVHLKADHVIFCADVARLCVERDDGEDENAMRWMRDVPRYEEASKAVGFRVFNPVLRGYSKGILERLPPLILNRFKVSEADAAAVESHGFHGYDFALIASRGENKFAMRLTWTDDGIAHRESVHQMFYGSWDAVQTTRKLIILG